MEVMPCQFWTWSGSGPTVFTLVPQSAVSSSGSVTALLRDCVESPHDSMEKERTQQGPTFGHLHQGARQVVKSQGPSRLPWPPAEYHPV